MQWLYDILDPNARTATARTYRLAYLMVLAVGLGAVILNSSRAISAAWGGASVGIRGSLR